MTSKDARPASGTGPWVGILTQTNAGSTGDQAMIDAASCYLARERGCRVIIGPNIFPTRSGARLPSSDGKAAVMQNLAGMVLRSRHIGFVGADVLDGVYGPAGIMKRLNLLKTGHRLGARTRVFGSSWSHNPSPVVIEMLRAMPWLHICARDPISKTRMEAALDREVALVADVAFLLQPEITSPEARAAEQWIDRKHAENATVLGLNLSGHTLEGVADHGVSAFAGLVGRWLDADPARAVLIMPHDRRPGMVGDLEVLDALNKALAARYADRIALLPATLDAWDIKALAGKVDFILTGRMHLAIAAFGMGTPALCTVYQGKFEGLMEHFALKDLTVSPDDVLAERCDDRLAWLSNQHVALGAAIRNRLPAILELSRKNFEGI